MYKALRPHIYSSVGRHNVALLFTASSADEEPGSSSSGPNHSVSLTPHSKKLIGYERILQWAT